MHLFTGSIKTQGTIQEMSNALHQAKSEIFDPNINKYYITLYITMTVMSVML